VRELHIQNDSADTYRFARDALNAIDLSVPVVGNLCPHCGVNIRYPLIARKSDIDKFDFLMRSAERVMKKYNITANLFAEIRADIAIELAKGKENK
jgi:hypothetical protein